MKISSVCKYKAGCRSGIWRANGFDAAWTEQTALSGHPEWCILHKSMITVDAVHDLRNEVCPWGSECTYIKPHSKIPNTPFAGDCPCIPACAIAGCGKPRFDGAPGALYCSRTCRKIGTSSNANVSSGSGSIGGAAITAKSTAALCKLPGCSKPTWNGKADEFCSKGCRRKADLAPQVTPAPLPVTTAPDEATPRRRQRQRRRRRQC